MFDPVSTTRASLTPHEELGPEDVGEPNFVIDEERRDWLLKNLGESICRKIGVYPIPDDFVLSVVIPVYNERKTIHEILRRVRAVPIRKQIIIVDDCSKDGTTDVLKELAKTEDDLTIQVGVITQRDGRSVALKMKQV